MDDLEEEHEKYSALYFNGRPPKFETAEEMAEQIQGYFNGGMSTRSVVVGSGADRKVIELPAPTITELALYLGFADRASFYDYEKKQEFSHTVKRARSVIEAYYERQLQNSTPTGAIFALKNFGWKDRSEVVLSPDVKTTRDKMKEFLDGTDSDGPARNDLPDNPDPADGEDSEET